MTCARALSDPCRRGAVCSPPDPATATYFSEAAGNAETILITAPAPGVWHLALLGYAAYSGVTLTATH